MHIAPPKEVLPELLKEGEEYLSNIKVKEGATDRDIRISM